MKGYNRVMEIFWLSIGMLIIIIVTVMGFMYGFDRWWQSYIFAILALGSYLLRRYMRKRMEKHMGFLQNEEQNEKQG